MAVDHDENLYKKFLEQMHDAVFILDQNFNIVDCNTMATKWYGYSKDEAIKLNLRDIRAYGERGKIAAHMHTAIQSNGATWETIHLRKDGSTFPVEVSSTQILIGTEKRFYHVVRDISARVKADLVLRASEERYKQIVDLSPSAIFLHRDEKIIYMNQAGFDMFGVTNPDQIIGKSLWMIYPTERHGIVRARNQAMEKSKGSVPLIEHTMLRLDNSTVQVEAIACYIEFEYKPAFYVLLRDISIAKKTNMYLELQYEVSRNLIESSSLIDATTNVIKSICYALKFDDGKLWSVDEKTETLRCINGWGNKNDSTNVDSIISRQSVVKMYEGLPGEAVSSAQPVWFDDLSNVPISKIPHESGYKMGVAVPIINSKVVIGALVFLSTKPRDRDESTISALLAIGNQVGLFLKRKSFEKDLLYISKHDSVTGLSNRFLFEETLSYALMISRNNDKRLAVLFIDIHQFSALNQAMGHLIGDEILKIVSARLLNLGCKGDNLARFGADQFALFMDSIERIEEVTEFVHQINDCIAQPIQILDQRINLGLCIGVSFYPEDGEDAQSLMRNANTALNHAKQSGRNTFEFCTVDMTFKARKRISTENDMREALQNDEFLLYYQPIVESASMSTRGFESLLRWKRRGILVSPADFIPVAEQTQLIVPIGEWVIRTACKQAKIWNSNLLNEEPVFVSVNISPVQFNYGNVLPLLISILDDSQLDPRCLKLEVTESAIMNDVAKSIKLLSKIKDLGVKISIDDFGTGYSSLNYLRHLPIDFIKIDQSFVRDMLVNSNDAAIVKTIIGLADNLSYSVIAEGVETQEQLKFLSNLGCSMIQGYYFSRPLIVDEATELLLQGKLI